MIPILLLALVALGLLWGRRDLVVLFALPLVLYPMPYYITHVYARFEWVVEPLILTLAGYSMSRFLEWLRPEA